MKNSEVQVGKRYLTRTIHYRTGLSMTRGEVRIEARVGTTLYVKWLMADGSERTDRGLPRTMKARQMFVEVKR